MEFCLLYVVPIMIGLKINHQTQYEEFINGTNATPLQTIFQNHDLAFAVQHQLIDSNETYERSSDTDKRRLVTVSEKIEQVYNAIFNHSYSGENYKTKIGELIFTPHDRSELLTIAGTLSEFADYTI